MASSLSDLLAEEVFHRRQKSPRDHSITIPLYICHTQSSSRRRGSTRPGSVSERSNSKSEPTRRDSPAIDEVSVRAVVSILSGYVGRYAKDEAFREKVREKCLSCLVSTRTDCDDDYEILEKLEVGIESVDSLVEERGAISNAKRVRSTAQILSVVASSLSGEHDSGTHLSACAQLYLAILHKLERNDVKSARHLLEVFCDSPFLARTHLAPDLWEHFFLPHLLHLKVWFSNEIECLGGSDERRAKALSKAYNAQVDIGTVEFASYYKKWLKLGAGTGSPSVPVIPLPGVPYRALPRRSSMESCSTNSSANKSLYNAVFGPTNLRQSASLISRSGTLKDMWDSSREDSVIIEKMMSGFSSNRSSSLHEHHRSRRRSSSSQHERYQKPENFRFFGCQQTLPLECSLPKNGSLRRKEESPNNNLGVSPQVARAIEAVSSSDSLEECEAAILVISKSWPDRGVEEALSKTPAVEGILEVLLASEDEEVCEEALSLLGRSELSRLMVLNADPQLEAFRRHLRSSGRLFLRAAAALRLLKPAAMNMAAAEWVPLVLRLLEFGGAGAAFYLLRQLLTGFEDEDRNMDNARQVVCLGGLGVIAARVGGAGEVTARFDAVEFVLRCVRADGSCRNYLSEGLSVEALLELVLLECRRTIPGGPAIELLFELLCLNRTQVMRILERVKEGWGGFNAMHILFAYLQKAKPIDRPLVAAILLHLDLLEDLSKASVFREEAVEAIVEALDCTTHNSDIQEQSARALLILSGRFSYTGDPSIENWLLQRAGLDGVSVNAFQRHDQNGREDEEALECWQRKAAAVLVRSGKERFMAGLSECIRNGIPSLSRASLVTASWMFMYSSPVSDPISCSTLVPCLLECLSHENDVEARVIASYTLLSLSKISAECASMIVSSGKDELLGNLQLVTWTANQLLSLVTS